MSSSSAVMDGPNRGPGCPKGTKLKLSPAEIERRAIHIKPYAKAASDRMMAATTPEQRKVWQAMGGQANAAKIKAMQAALTPENPEGIRARRIKLEGKRDDLLDHLLACAAGKKDLQADLGIIKAALAELRPEIGLLIDREERAKAAGPSVPTAPRAPIGPAATVQPAPASFPILAGQTSVAVLPAQDSPGILSPDIPAAHIPPPIAAD